MGKHASLSNGKIHGKRQLHHKREHSLLPLPDFGNLCIGSNLLLFFTENLPFTLFEISVQRLFHPDSLHFVSFDFRALGSASVQINRTPLLPPSVLGLVRGPSSP